MIVNFLKSKLILNQNVINLIKKKLSDLGLILILLEVNNDIYMISLDKFEKRVNKNKGRICSAILDD